MNWLKTITNKEDTASFKLGRNNEPYDKSFGFAIMLSRDMNLSNSCLADQSFFGVPPPSRIILPLPPSPHTATPTPQKINNGFWQKYWTGAFGSFCSCAWPRGPRVGICFGSAMFLFSSNTQPMWVAAILEIRAEQRVLHVTCHLGWNFAWRHLSGTQSHLRMNRSRWRTKGRDKYEIFQQVEGALGGSAIQGLCCCKKQKTPDFWGKHEFWSTFCDILLEKMKRCKDLKCTSLLHNVSVFLFAGMSSPKAYLLSNSADRCSTYWQLPWSNQKLDHSTTWERGAVQCGRPSFHYCAPESLWS